jgi:hypothetical protein
VINEFLLCDHLAGALGKIDQNIERPAAEGKHFTIAPKDPLADRKLKRAKLEIFTKTVSHGFQLGLRALFRTVE